MRTFVTTVTATVDTDAEGGVHFQWGPPPQLDEQGCLDFFMHQALEAGCLSAACEAAARNHPNAIITSTGVPLLEFLEKCVRRRYRMMNMFWLAWQSGNVPRTCRAADIYLHYRMGEDPKWMNPGFTWIRSATFTGITENPTP